MAQSWGEEAGRGRTPQLALARKVAQSWGAQALRGRSLVAAQLLGTFWQIPGPALYVWGAEVRLNESGSPQGHPQELLPW